MSSGRYGSTSHVPRHLDSSSFGADGACCRRPRRETSHRSPHFFPTAATSLLRQERRRAQSGVRFAIVAIRLACATSASLTAWTDAPPLHVIVHWPSRSAPAIERVMMFVAG